MHERQLIQTHLRDLAKCLKVGNHLLVCAAIGHSTGVNNA